MHNRTGKILFTALSVIFLCATMAVAGNKTLSLVSLFGSSTNVPVVQEEPITLLVEINDGSLVAGGSFTIAYDTTNLVLSSIESTFFDTFVNQSIPTDNDQGYVTVGSDDYYSPLILGGPVTIDNSPPTGSLLAAARVDNGTATDTTLFTLNFVSSGDSGTYPVSIIQSTISNVSAGYAEAGELIPYLVGIDGTSYLTYPNNDNTGNIVTTIGCTLAINAFDDAGDGDGIDDNWERDHVPGGTDLNVFTANGDSDGDGYSDYQEYLNRNLTDSLGNPYDPTVANAPDGPGYVVPSSGTAALPAIYMLLLGD